MINGSHFSGVRSRGAGAALPAKWLIAGCGGKAQQNTHKASPKKIKKNKSSVSSTSPPLLLCLFIYLTSPGLLAAPIPECPTHPPAPHQNIMYLEATIQEKKKTQKLIESSTFIHFQQSGAVGAWRWSAWWASVPASAAVAADQGGSCPQKAKCSYQPLTKMRALIAQKSPPPS